MKHRLASIKLPPKNTNRGIEVRVFLAESMNPSRKEYNLPEAMESMQWMHLILWNRVHAKHLSTFQAKLHALLSVVTAPNQFQGFQHYPYFKTKNEQTVRDRIQGVVDAANNQKGKGRSNYIDLINAAVQIAGNQTSTPDPSPEVLAAWQTSGKNYLPSNFIFFKTILNNDFYYITKQNYQNG